SYPRRRPSLSRLNQANQPPKNPERFSHRGSPGFGVGVSNPILTRHRRWPPPRESPPATALLRARRRDLPLSFSYTTPRDTTLEKKLTLPGRRILCYPIPDHRSGCDDWHTEPSKGRIGASFARHRLVLGFSRHGIVCRRFRMSHSNRVRPERQSGNVLNISGSGPDWVERPGKCGRSTPRPLQLSSSDAD
ncbi:hypothetical protein EU555_35890, partial [Methylobacterium nonmethylotrophicum]